MSLQPETRKALSNARAGDAAAASATTALAHELAALADVLAGDTVSAGIQRVTAQQVNEAAGAGPADLSSRAHALAIQLAHLRAAFLTGKAHKDAHDPNDGSDPLDTAVAGSIQPDDAAAIGTAHTLARSDHKHSISCTTPVEIAHVQDGAEGTDVHFARSNHIHAISHGIADNHLVTVDGSPADDEYAKWTADGLEGRSYAQVRTDINVADGADVTGANAPQAHHDSHDPEDGSDALDCAAPDTNVTPEAANAEGDAHTFARSDHMHYLPCGAASDVGASNTEGTAEAFARQDHVHALPAKYRTICVEQVFRNPVATAEGENLIISLPNYAGTIVYVAAVCIGAGSTCTFNLRIQDRDAAAGAGTQVFTSDQNMTTTLTAFTPDVTAVGARKRIVVEHESLGGTIPDETRVFVELLIT